MKKVYPYALISLILGIVSYLQLLGIERALLAVIFGVVALKNIKRNNELKGLKYAYWGIGLGLVYMLIVLLIILFKGNDILSILRLK